MKNGWHNIAGYRVLVEDGNVIRGIIGSGLASRPGYVYRLNRKQACWTSERGITVEAFRAGVRRGTIELK